MDANRRAHLNQLTSDIGKWLREAERLEKDGLKSRAAVLRGWARSASRVVDRIKELPSNFA
jgi:hypothetical protein